MHKQHNVGSAPERRLRITDLVNLSQANPLPAQTTTVADDSPTAVDCQQQLVYADSIQMLQLAEGMALLNGSLSLLSSGEGHTIAMLPDQTLVLHPSSAQTSNTVFQSLQFVAMDDQQVVANGDIIQNDTATSCISKDESESCQFVV